MIGAMQLADQEWLSVWRILHQRIQPAPALKRIQVLQAAPQGAQQQCISPLEHRRLQPCKMFSSQAFMGFLPPRLK